MEDVTWVTIHYNGNNPLSKSFLGSGVIWDVAGWTFAPHPLLKVGWCDDTLGPVDIVLGYVKKY